LLWPLVALVIAILVIRRAATAKELADLISAFASLIWALVPIAILISFSQEIRTILSRMRIMTRPRGERCTGTRLRVRPRAQAACFQKTLARSRSTKFWRNCDPVHTGSAGFAAIISAGVKIFSVVATGNAVRPVTVFDRH
jgi:hypothetical protein